MYERIWENNMKKISKLCFAAGLMFILWSMMLMGVSAAAAPAKVTNAKVTAQGTIHKISWKKVSNVTGYQVYCKDYSSDTNLFKKVKTVTGASKKSVQVAGRKIGRAYAYCVRAYIKDAEGTVTYGKFSDIVYGYSKEEDTTQNEEENTVTETEPSETNPSETNPSSSKLIVNPTKKQKYKLVFGDASLNLWYPGGYYKTQAEAEKNMKSITVKTWDFANGKSGPKITRTWTIKVHKKLATTVKQIFKEIYEGEEQFPIHELGGYAWRGGHSEHNTGTAIDINWTENYMIQNGQIVCGSFWKPGKDPYSIPKNGEVAKIFKKYGFAQGDWGNTKDYMHFSYFET